MDKGTVEIIKAMVESHNSANRHRRITFDTAKTVYGRGVSALTTLLGPVYSPISEISKQKAGIARLKAFIHKAATGTSETGTYPHDNDLLDAMGIEHEMYKKGGDVELLAPNGKPSNLTPEQWHLVRTPEFKAWFGDWENDPENASKVLDENGEPLVCYHGSRSYFNIFDYKKSGASNTTSKVGFWFTPIKKFAENFASTIWYGESDKVIVYSVFLSIKNPKLYESEIVDEKKKEKLRLQIKDLQKESLSIQEKWVTGNWDYRDRMVLDYSIRGMINDKNYDYYSKLTEKSIDAINDGLLIAEINKKRNDIENKIWGATYTDSYQKYRTEIYKHEGKSSQEANIGGLGMTLSDPSGTLSKYILSLTENGHDGIIINKTRFDAKEAGGFNDQYVALFPNQIKLADGSNTTFDSSNPDIRFAKGGLIEVVLNEGSGNLINRLYTEWNNIKTEKQWNAWAEKVRNAKSGTYGTIGLPEMLERFDFKNSTKANEIQKSGFISEVNTALNSYELGGILDGLSEEEVMYIDIISNYDGKGEIAEKYKKILKEKTGINYDEHYGKNDELLIENADLKNIKNKNDFLNYDNWIKYCYEIFRKRGFAKNQPKHIEGIVSLEKSKLFFESLDIPFSVMPQYEGRGNYAEHSAGTIRIPENVDINTFIHELGHYYDWITQYEGIAKNPAYATSPYGLKKSNEVYAENFMHYFIAKDWIKDNLPLVFNELDKTILNQYKVKVIELIESVNPVFAEINNPYIRFSEGGEIQRYEPGFKPGDNVSFLIAGGKYATAKVQFYLPPDHYAYPNMYSTTKGYVKEGYAVPAVASAKKESQGSGYKAFKGIGGGKSYVIYFEDGSKHTAPSYIDDRNEAVAWAINHRISTGSYPKTKAVENTQNIPPVVEHTTADTGGEKNSGVSPNLKQEEMNRIERMFAEINDMLKGVSNKFNDSDFNDKALTDIELENIIGRDVFKAVQRAESQLGDGIVDRNRMIETAKKIQKADGKAKLLPEHIFEALQYEFGYPDNWQDLRNAVKKGGIDINSEAIQRQIEVGVKLPTDLVEEFKKSNRFKTANLELVKAVEEVLKSSAGKMKQPGTDSLSSFEELSGKPTSVPHLESVYLDDVSVISYPKENLKTVEKAGLIKNAEGLKKLIRDDGKIYTIKEFIEKLLKNGNEFKVVDVPKYKEPTRSQYNRMNWEQQRESDAKTSSGETKKEYRAYYPDGSYSELRTKTEYDYAMGLISLADKFNMNISDFIDYRNTKIKENQELIKAKKIQDDLERAETIKSEKIKEQEKQQEFRKQRIAKILTMPLDEYLKIKMQWIEDSINEIERKRVKDNYDLDRLNTLISNKDNYKKEYTSEYYNLRQLYEIDEYGEVKKLNSWSIGDTVLLKNYDVKKDGRYTNQDIETTIIEERQNTLGEKTYKVNGVENLEFNQFVGYDSMFPVISLSEVKKNESLIPEKERELLKYVSDILQSGSQSDIRNITSKAKQLSILNANGDPDRTKIKEVTELAVCIVGREMAHEPGDVQERYRNIVKLYYNQANLSSRTSESKILQQYSTPVPIAYLAGVFCGFEKKGRYFEPSAGNGLLTVAGRAEDFTVNEIDPLRRRNLEYQGFGLVTGVNAENPFTEYAGFFDAAITNPPFGSIKHDKYVAKGLEISKLEHMMAIHALDTVKNDGRCAIIIGGHTEFDSVGRIRAGADRNFYVYLARYYNVVDSINISGKMYSRQGTSFNVRLLLIDGKKEVPEGFPPIAVMGSPSSEAWSGKPVNDYDEFLERMLNHI